MLNLAVSCGKVYYCYRLLSNIVRQSKTLLSSGVSDMCYERLRDVSRNRLLLPIII